MKVYDCFIFFNELDLLELRLKELYDKVDYFVIVEARKTFGDDKKPLHYELNKNRYHKWAKKIIHVVPELPRLRPIDHAFIRAARIGPLYKLTSKITAFGFGRWKIEHALRNGILQGLRNAKDDDVIMVSDIDEIPKPSTLQKAISIAKRGKTVGLHQTMYYYYLNGLTDIYWVGTKLCTRKTLRERHKDSPQYLRTPIYAMIAERLFKRKIALTIVDDGGWHFSYMGGVERVIAKKTAGSHAEISTGKDVSRHSVQADIKKGIFSSKQHVYRIKYIPLNDTLPKTVLRERKRFSKLIMKV